MFRILICASFLIELQANKTESILVPPCLRWCLTSLDDRQTGHHGCRGNCSSSWLACCNSMCYLIYRLSESTVSGRNMKAQRLHEDWYAKRVLLKAVCGLKWNSPLDVQWFHWAKGVRCWGFSFSQLLCNHFKKMHLVPSFYIFISVLIICLLLFNYKYKFITAEKNCKCKN